MKTDFLSYLCVTAVAVGCALPRGAAQPDTFSVARVERTSVLKHSDVTAWFDKPEDHVNYETDFIVQDMDIVDESELPKWKEFIGQLHAKGKRFCADLRPLTQLGRLHEHVMNDPGLQEAVCLDFTLTPIRTNWIKSLHKGRPVHLYCTNHPRYRAFLRHQIYMIAEAGADAIHVDDGGGALFSFNAGGGCCCPYCTVGFRAYLRGKYSPDQLAALGIDDLGTFEYRRILLQHADERESFQAARRRNEIPLAGDFRQFLIGSDAGLFRSLQEMADKLSGRHVPMGWDNVDFGGARAPYYRFLDMFVAEINYQNFAVAGRGKDTTLSPAILVLDKLSDALGKWYLPTPAPGSWTAIKTGNLTGLLQLWIAGSYANGGLLRYPRKGWCFGDTSRWYYPPKAEFEPLYDFVRTHRALFDDYEAVTQVGVVFTQPSNNPTRALKHVTESLVNLNIPFGIVVAGNQWVPNRLSPRDADRFGVILIPDAAELDAAQQQVVEAWKQRKAVIPVSPTDDMGQHLSGRVDSLVAVDGSSSIRLFPRMIPDRAGAPVVCHLVNWGYDAQANRTPPEKDVPVRLRTALIGGSRVSKVAYHTIGKPAQALDFAVRDGAIHVTVPEVALWGVLELERK